jgi:hypothetical protein
MFQTLHKSWYTVTSYVPLPGQCIQVRMNLMAMIRNSDSGHPSEELMEELELMSSRLDTYRGVVYKVYFIVVAYYYTHNHSFQYLEALSRTNSWHACLLLLLCSDGDSPKNLPATDTKPECTESGNFLPCRSRWVVIPARLATSSTTRPHQPARMSPHTLQHIYERSISYQYIDSHILCRLKDQSGYDDHLDDPIGTLYPTVSEVFVMTTVNYSHEHQGRYQ